MVAENFLWCPDGDLWVQICKPWHQVACERLYTPRGVEMGSPWKFKVKVMAKVKPDGHIWGLKFNRYIFAFRFVAIGLFLTEIWQKSYLTLKIQGQGHGQGQTRWSHFRPEFNLFISWQADHFWLRYSKFHIWPWKFKVQVMTKVDKNLIRWSIGQGQQSCQK